MRRHDEGGQFTATARGGASAGAQGNTEVEERLDGGGRHDVWAYHGVEQLIPRRGPVMRPGPSSCQTRPGIHESTAASTGAAPPPMGRLLGTSTGIYRRDRRPWCCAWYGYVRRRAVGSAGAVTSA